MGCVYEKGGQNFQEFGPVILASGASLRGLCGSCGSLDLDFWLNQWIYWYLSHDLECGSFNSLPEFNWTFVTFLGLDHSVARKKSSTLVLFSFGVQTSLERDDFSRCFLFPGGFPVDTFHEVGPESQRFLLGPWIGANDLLVRTFRPWCTRVEPTPCLSHR